MPMPNSCDLSFRFDPEPYQAFDATEVFYGKTPYFLVSAGASVTATMRTFGVAGQWQAKLAAEVCTVRPTAPTTTEDLSSAITTTTTTGVATTISGGSYMFCRLGYKVSLVTGTTPAAGLIGMDVTIHQCIKPVAAGRVVVNPTLTGSASEAAALIAPIGGFFSAVSAPKLKATIVGRDLENYADFRTKLVYRTAMDPESPNGWQTGLESDDTPAGTNDERNTGELTPTVGTNRLLQTGLLVRRAVTGGVIRGDFDVLVTVIR